MEEGDSSPRPSPPTDEPSGSRKASERTPPSDEKRRGALRRSSFENAVAGLSPSGNAAAAPRASADGRDAGVGFARALARTTEPEGGGAADVAGSLGASGTGRNPGAAAPVESRVTAGRPQRDAQQPRPDAKELLELFPDDAELLREASQAEDATRRRADAAMDRVRRLSATQTLGLASGGAAGETTAEKAEAAVKATADAARAANFYAHAASVCQRAAKDLEHVAQSEAAYAGAAARVARADGASTASSDAADKERRATEASGAVESARQLANRAADVLEAARAAAVVADAKRQEAAAFAADHAAAAANAPGPNAAANAADAESATDDEIDYDDDGDDDNLIAAAIARDDNIQPNVPRDETRDDVMSIKCGLKNLLHLQDEQKTNFEAKIREIVKIVSQLRVRAFQAMTLFCIRTLGEDRKPDDFFDSLVHGKGGDRFWREALRDPERASRKRQTDAMLLLREIRGSCGGPVLEIPGGMSHILNSVAKELSTAFRNHLAENFFERQLQMHRALVLRHHVATDGGIVRGNKNERRKGVNELAHWLSRRVNRKQSELVDFENKDERDRAATQRFNALGDDIKTDLQNYAVAERATLGLGDEDFVTQSWLRRVDPARVLRLLRWTWDALVEIEKIRADDNLEAQRVELELRIRTFTICPQSQIQAAYVPIDATSFFRLCASLGIWESGREAEFTGRDTIDQTIREEFGSELQSPRIKQRRDELKVVAKNNARRNFWGQVFNLKKLRRGNRNLDFAGHIRTDGISVSVMYKRLNDHDSVSRMTENRLNAERTLREATPDELARRRIIGIDPGRRTLCYATEEIVGAAPNDDEARRRRLFFESVDGFVGPVAPNVGDGDAGWGARDGDAGDAGNDDAGGDDAGGGDARGGGRRARRRGRRGRGSVRRRRQRTRRKHPRRGRRSRGARRARRNYKSYMLTRAWYYRRSGINAARKRSRRWLEQPGVKQAFEDFHATTVKTTSSDVYRAHVDAYVNNFDTLWTEKLRPRWARQKFRLYCGKRRALQEFVNNLRGDEIPLIAYGAAGIASGGRGERSVPVKGIQRLVRQTYPTVLVDEYNTTKMCPTCHVPLQHVKVRIRQRDESWKKVTCHDLRRCGNRGPWGCASLGCSWKNRDEAASLNIGRCARLNAVKAGHDVANRPAFLRRRAPGEPKHPDKTVFHCRPVDDESGAPKKIGRGA